MKRFIVLSAIVALSAADVSFYTTDNDYLDADKVMSDPAVVKTYIDCYLDKGPCDPLALSYKLIMPDALAHSCTRCNDAQKHLWSKFLWYLKEKYPEYLAAYSRKYDPNNEYIPALWKVVSSY